MFDYVTLGGVFLDRYACRESRARDSNDQNIFGDERAFYLRWRNLRMEMFVDR